MDIGMDAGSRQREEEQEKREHKLGMTLAMVDVDFKVGDVKNANFERRQIGDCCR